MSNGLLGSDEYRDIFSSKLVPMFAGCTLKRGMIYCDINADMVVPDGKRNLLVRPDRRWPYRLTLERTSPFDSDDVKIVDQFVRAFGEKLIAAEQPYFQYILDKCPEDVVACSVQHKSFDDSLLPAIISVFRKWASQTYEGSRISVAIGVDARPNPSLISNIHFYQLVERDHAKVLSNGMDTLIVLSPSGHVVEHLALGEQPIESADQDVLFTPLRYRQLARWAKGTRTALTLNRHGEILVFKNRQLKFAFRRGTWCHYSHKVMVERMGGNSRQKRLMRAVYESCLDVSFTRTGACIAIAITENTKALSKCLADEDLLGFAKTDKATLLKHLIGKSFPDIPRPIREEMAALDGAIVLDSNGVVLTAGAIVRVSGGSKGGGRRAAAEALSRLGLAIKVSSDGGITAFSDRGTARSPEIAFDV